MPLVAKAPPIIRMQYDQPGDGDDNVLEAYADIDAYRGLWYARGWRSPVDDPEFVGEVEPEPEDPWRGPAGPIANGAGTLALRPVVGDVATGFSYWASDDDGGQRWVKSGGVWVKDGRPTTTSVASSSVASHRRPIRLSRAPQPTPTTG